MTVEAAELVAALRDATQPLRLHGAVQPYAWGGEEFIPRLVGAEPSPGHPAAELWLGAHPVAPANATVAGRTAPLDAVVAAAPELVLGERVAARFERTLPYLLKVLDVHAMLSIQAHPTLEQAREGFARENASSIPVDSPQRIYRDPNHKPEMQVALGEFWMLHGFRRLADVARDLDAVPELRPLLPELITHAPEAWTAGEERAAWRRIYARVMTLPQQDIDRALVPLIARLKAQRAHRSIDRSSPDFWAVRAADQFPLAEGHVDRGLVSIYLLNLLRLDAGEATFIPAGVLHAYLEGRTVELMAASDNVLRGGLTPKHVDVAELLRILTFEPTEPARLRPASRGGHTEFTAPVAEFALERWALAAGESTTERRDDGPTTLLVLGGRVIVTYGHDATRGQSAGSWSLPLDRGGAVLVPASLSYAMTAETDCVVFAAVVPEHRV